MHDVQVGDDVVTSIWWGYKAILPSGFISLVMLLSSEKSGSALDPKLSPGSLSYILALVDPQAKTKPEINSS